MSQIHDYPNTVTTFQGTDLFDIDVDMGGGVFESQKAPYANLLTNLDTNLFGGGVLGDTLHHNGTKFIANSFFFVGGDNNVRVKSSQAGATGGVAFKLENTAGGGTVWQTTNISTGHGNLPQNGYTIFDANAVTSLAAPGDNLGLGEHRFIMDDAGQTLLGGFDRIITANTPGAMLDIIGETSDNTKKALIVRDRTRTEFFSFRNDSRLIYTDGNQALNKVLTSDASGVGTWQALGAAAPGGADTQVQFNNVGVLDGSADLRFRNTGLHKALFVGDGAVFPAMGAQIPNQAFVVTGSSSNAGAYGYNNATSRKWELLTGGAGGMFAILSTGTTRTIQLNGNATDSFINNGADFGLGVSVSISARFHARGANTSTGTNAILIENSASTAMFRVTNANEIGVFNTTPAGQTAAYTVTNPVTRRTFDTTTVTLQQLAEVVGTGIVDEQSFGWFG